MQDSKILLQQVLAELVKKHRNKTKKSISLISDEINLSKSIWSDLEKGKKDPQFSTLWRVCVALEIKLSDLILEIEQKSDKINFLEEQI